MELLYTPTSPFTRKVMLVIHELGRTEDLKLVTVDPRRDVFPVFLRNPLGKFPVLTTAEGLHLYDSNVICEWVNDKFGGSLYGDEERKWEVLKEVAVADGILEAAIFIRQALQQPVTQRSQSQIDRETARIHFALNALEVDRNLFNGPLTLGHLSLGGAIDWLPFRLPQENWLEKRSRLTERLAVLTDRASFRATDPRRA